VAVPDQKLRARLEGIIAAQHNALLCLSRVTPPHCLIRAVTRRNRCLAWNVTVAMLVSVQDFS
jgi:hypothetical protein